MSRTLFPLGEMQKPAVRRMAAEAGLALAEKPDSQEICFIPGGDYSAFLAAYLDEQGEALPDSAGELVTADRRGVGAALRCSRLHRWPAQGAWRRTGGCAELRAALRAGDPSRLAPRHRRRRRRADVAGAAGDRLNWISVAGLAGEMRVRVKIRHRHEPAWATLSPDGEDCVRAIFDQPQRAITPGQAAVFYDGDEVVGGGWIV